MLSLPQTTLLGLYLALLSLLSTTEATTVPLSHNIPHHIARRSGDGAWLLREKAKLDTKYGPTGEALDRRREEDALGRRSRGGLDLAAEVDMTTGKYSGRRRSRLDGRAGDVTLANHNSDASYSASVTIGSPGESFDLAMDTGSSDLWVASSVCGTGSCSGLSTYHAASSSTFKNSSTSFTINYGSGSAYGTLGTDTVALGGYSVVSQTIAVVNSMTASLITSPMSGIMGLGFQALSVSGATPWWASLAASSSWSSPLFGVYLARYRDVTNAAQTESQGGYLTLGYTDSSLYSGNINYVSVTQQRYWNVPIASMTMQGTTISLGSSNNAAIDTGTTLIGGPADQVAAIYAAIPGSQPMGSSYPNYYEYPCSTSINFQMTFGSMTITVTNQDFNIGRYSSDQSMCTGGVYIQSLASSSPVQWVVGDTLLKNCYTVFRSSPAAVGFAALAGAATSSAAGLSTGIPSGSVLPGSNATATSTSAISSASSSSASITSRSSTSASASVTSFLGIASSSSSDAGASGVTITAQAAPASSSSAKSAGFAQVPLERSVALFGLAVALLGAFAI